MEQLKAWTERFKQIQGRYDGGRAYTWGAAVVDLGEIETDIRSTLLIRGFMRAQWKRDLAYILLQAVVEEKKRLMAKL